MCPTDEYGIEYDADVETALKDPKATIVTKLFDYLGKRKEAKKLLDDKEAQEKKKKEEKESSVFPF